MIEKQWLVKPEDSAIEELQTALNISPITAKILVNRGINTVDQGKDFLHCGYEDLHSPWDLPDMVISIKRIVQALSDKEKITIYGDYDVDGQTGTALLVKVLQRLAKVKDQIDYYIPHRMDEGYGLHKDALTEIAKNSSLVITVDCGISAIEEGKYAKQLGLDLIITDHHEPGSELPVAVGVINPKRGDSIYPFTELAGVGVAYKVVQALGEHYQKDFREYLDLVALGTVADLVPLIGENRIFAKIGLETLSTTSCVGLKSLVQVCELKKPYNAGDLGYRLGPRLNAVGRMGEPSRGMALLLTEDPEEAAELANILDRENKARQTIEAEIYAEAKTIIEEAGWEQDSVIIVANEQWHPGVIGIVASRLVETYYRPTIVIALEDGIGKASARSIAGFNLFQGLAACSELLEKYGGHEMAAGLSIKEENIPLLREYLTDLVANTLSPDDFIPKLLLDAAVSFGQLNQKLLQEFNLLEPFGIRNPTPVLQVSGSVQEVRAIGDGTHLACQIQDETGETIRAVGFGMYQRMHQMQGYYEQMNFAVCPQPGYRDNTIVELLLRDIQPAVIDSNYVEHWITHYPWNLTSGYGEIFLFKNGRDLPLVEETKPASYSMVDGRNVWNKMELLFKELDIKKTALIYVATPKQAMDVCRQLRIAIPGDPSFIGFEHEYISETESLELQQLISEGHVRWVVSTGLSRIMPHLWEQVAYYSVPVTPELLETLASRVVDHGKLIALYNKTDVNWYQGQIKQAFPDRNLLARFYQKMTVNDAQEVPREHLTDIAGQLSLRAGLSFILGVFQELGLVECTEQTIKILPKPAERLDLYSSLLYNEGMQKCELYYTYSQHCLERGFLDESNGKDTDYRRFS